MKGYLQGMYGDEDMNILNKIASTGDEIIYSAFDVFESDKD